MHKVRMIEMRSLKSELQLHPAAYQVDNTCSRVRKQDVQEKHENHRWLSIFLVMECFHRWRKLVTKNSSIEWKLFNSGFSTYWFSCLDFELCFLLFMYCILIKPEKIMEVENGTTGGFISHTWSIFAIQL